MNVGSSEDQKRFGIRRRKQQSQREKSRN